MTVALTPPKVRRLPRTRSLLWALLVAFLLFGASSALGAVLGVLALLGATAVLVWRKPAWAAVTLVALVPINRFLILLVFHFGHSASLTVLAQAWKDLLIGLLFLRAIDEAILRRRPKLHYVDLLVAAYLAISVLYLFYPGSLGQVSFTDRLLGFRADSYFMVAYFVGRWLVFERRHIRWFLLSLLPGTALVSIIAAAQFAKPNWFNRFFNKLGFSAFINTQSALGGDIDVIRERGIAGVNLPRASSLLLGDLALAFYSVMAVAVAAAIFFTARRTVTRWVSGAVVVLGVAAIGFSITRSAVIAVFVMLVVMAVMTRGMFRMSVIAGVLVTAGLFALVSGAISVEAVQALTNPHEASIQGHGGAIQRAVDTVDSEPLGQGLGTSGTIGQRVLGAEAITTENWYLQIATELGIVAGLVFVAFSIAVAIDALRSFLRVRDLALRRLCLAVVGASVGTFIVGNTLSVWEVPAIAMAFWLLAGIAVGARETDVDPEYQASRA